MLITLGVKRLDVDFVGGGQAWLGFVSALEVVVAGAWDALSGAGSVPTGAKRVVDDLCDDGASASAGAAGCVAGDVGAGGADGEEEREHVCVEGWAVWS